MKYRLWFAAIAVIFFAACKNNKTAKNDEKKKAETQAYIKSLAAQVQQHSDSTGLRFNYINALDSTGDYKTAIAQMENLLNKDKGNYGLWYKFGQLYEHSGDTLQAITCYKNALHIYNAPDGLIALANLYAEKKNPETISICRQLNELRLGREYDSYSNFFTGVYYSRIGNKTQAINFFNKSINDNYTLMDAYMEKGYASFDDKKYNEALKVFTAAVTVNNLYSDAYYWQGKCYEALNNKQLAVSNYKQALAIDKNLTEAYLALKRLE